MRENKFRRLVRQSGRFLRSLYRFLRAVLRVALGRAAVVLLDERGRTRFVFDVKRRA